MTTASTRFECQCWVTHVHAVGAITCKPPLFEAYRCVCFHLSIIHWQLSITTLLFHPKKQTWISNTFYMHSEHSEQHLNDVKLNDSCWFNHWESLTNQRKTKPNQTRCTFSCKLKWNRWFTWTILWEVDSKALFDVLNFLSNFLAAPNLLICHRQSNYEWLSL